jgi:hypothetical protein
MSEKCKIQNGTRLASKCKIQNAKFKKGKRVRRSSTIIPFLAPGRPGSSLTGGSQRDQEHHFELSTLSAHAHIDSEIQFPKCFQNPSPLPAFWRTLKTCAYPSLSLFFF